MYDLNKYLPSESLQKALDSFAETLITNTIVMTESLIKLYMAETGLKITEIELIEQREVDKIVFYCRPKSK
jgi:hypothetical protein